MQVARFSPFLGRNYWNSFCRRSLCNETHDYLVVTKSEGKKFVERCIRKVGAGPAEATELANVLLEADHRGHFSHGLNRTEMYVNEIKTGVTTASRRPRVVKESSATAYIDGEAALGPTVGNFSMALAIEKAQQSGVGWVVAGNSNHYGIAGWYSMAAAKQGLLGMSFTNTSPFAIPTRAKERVLGTNPITLAAPGLNGDDFVLDMATTTVAQGKIEMHERKGIPIPAGWGADSSGKTTDDPSAVLRDGGLLPLGGTELMGGYKGYGLGMMVEIFCGILADSSYAKNVRTWKDMERPANLGQCFIAVDPECFGPGFKSRMSDFMAMCRNLDPVSDSEKVLVAGDPERIHMQKCEDQGGISYHKNVIDHLDTLADSLDVARITR